MDRKRFDVLKTFFFLTFNGQQTEVIFKPLTLNAVTFLPAINGKRLTPLNFEKLFTVNVYRHYILI
jgi:hypothetical protein